MTVGGQARLATDDVLIAGLQASCTIGAEGLSLTESGQATLTRSAIRDVGGSALVMFRTSKATLTETEITRTMSSECAPPPSVRVFESASLILTSSSIVSNGGTNAFGIRTSSAAPLTMNGTGIEGFSDAGIEMTGSGKLTVDGSSFRGNAIGISARGATTNPSDITVTGTTLSSFNSNVEASVFKLRRSNLFGRIGILIVGAEADLSTTIRADLGTLADPGGNTIHAGETGVRFNQSTNRGTVQAVGKPGTRTRRARTPAGATRCTSWCSAWARAPAGRTST